VTLLSVKAKTMRRKKPEIQEDINESSITASIARSMFGQQTNQASSPMSGEEISKEILSHFSQENDLKPVLSDEISLKKVQFVVEEVAMIIGGSRVSAAHWRAVANFLSKELVDFREMKQEFLKAERKLVLVRQRLNEATHPADGVVSKTKIMACSMLFGETEMRRDHLHARISMIIHELTRRILGCIASDFDRDELEIRLRGVLGSF